MSSLLKDARWQLAFMIADDAGIDWDTTPYEVHQVILAAAQAVLEVAPNSIAGLAATFRDPTSG